MTPAELDALEARLATIDDEVWTILGGNANVTMGHIKALRAAAPQLIASARALESLRGLVDAAREAQATYTARVSGTDRYGAECLLANIDDAVMRIGDAALTFFPEET